MAFKSGANPTDKRTIFTMASNGASFEEIRAVTKVNIQAIRNWLEYFSENGPPKGINSAEGMGAMSALQLMAHERKLDEADDLQEEVEEEDEE